MNLSRSIILFFVVVFTTISCKAPSLEESRLVEKHFSTDEISQLRDILSFFDEQICGDANTTSTVIKECLRRYNAWLEKTFGTDDFTGLPISFDDQKELYNSLNDSLIFKIWYSGRLEQKEKTTALLDINPYDVYSLYLKDLASQEPTLLSYYDSLKGGEGMSPAMITSMTYEHEKLDITDERIRLVMAIHYLTRNDQFERQTTLLENENWSIKD